MRLTKNRLRRIIREEVNRLNERRDGYKTHLQLVVPVRDREAIQRELDNLAYAYEYDEPYENVHGMYVFPYNNERIATDAFNHLQNNGYEVYRNW